MATRSEGDLDDGESVDLGRAAEFLGMSPTALARLLDSGALPWVPTRDVRIRRIRLVDLEAHREERFALRHRLAQQTRDRRVSVPGPDLVTH